MRIEQALKTAIEMEGRIRDVYAEACRQCPADAGQKVLAALRDDEQYHLDYLQARLDEWQQSGQLSVVALATSIPSPEVISRQLDKLQQTMTVDDRGVLQQMLGKALKVEVETSRFYEKMAAEMTDTAQQMFARFLEIENAHINAVQTELDYAARTGYWFDFKEFDME